MENRKTYIIADFVKILGVARTTLKDWLVRYEEYIEFEVRGHRKIYFDTSLNVLKRILAMRNVGKTASEIITELSNEYSMAPDIASEESEKGNKNFLIKSNSPLEALLPIVKKQSEEMEHILVEKLQDVASDLHEAQLAALLPIVKRQSEKMERMLTGKLQDMASDLHRNQLDANKLSKQQSRWLLLIIALILTVVIAVVLSSTNIYHMLMNQKEDFSSVGKKLGKTISQNKDLFITEAQKRIKADKEQQLKMQTLSVMLENSTKSSSNNIANLKADLSDQQQNFNAMMDKYNRAMIEQRKNEIKSLKETFGNELGVLLKKIDDLAKQREYHAKKNDNEQIHDLKEKIFELHQKIKILAQEKSKAEQTQRMPVMIFPNSKTPANRSNKKNGDNEIER